jgi:HEAT repeat protein
MPLSLLAQNDAWYVSSYLRLAERLWEKGNVETCLLICDEILNNENDYYSDNNRINALSILALYNPEEGKNYFFEILSKQNKRMRVAVLDLVSNYDSPELVSEIFTLAPDKPFEVQTEIIEILGRKESDSVSLFLRESLKSPSSEVRMSAIKALSETRDFEEFPEFLKVMQDSLDENEFNQIQSIFLSNADSTEIDYLMGYYYDFSLSSKILLINVLSTRRNAAYQKVFLESLKASYSPLRMSALRALQFCGDDNSLDAILLFLFKSEEEKEIKVANQAISSIINRSQFKNKQIKLIKSIYDKSSIDGKILLFGVFKNVGGNELMSILVDGMQSNDEQIRQATIQILSEWPDPDAIEILIDIGKNAQSERNQIIALRGALRILRENPMGEQRALLYYKEMMNMVTRPEEKLQILAGLAEIRTVSSLTLISSFLHDPEINQESFLAALKVSSKSEGQVDYLSREEIVISLIESQSDKELIKKIKIYTQDNIRKPKPPKGFSVLFNGINLDGWKGLVQNPIIRAEMSDDELRKDQNEADKLMSEHWQVIDGILYFDGKGTHLCTVSDYTDYEMFVDWKIEKEGDSGIYLRGSPQVQIWDPAIWPEGSGGLYNNQKHPNKPLHKADNPVGEWNTFHIIMQGEKVSVFLNDILVVDNVVMENYWERDKPIYSSGQIELQSHNTPLYFKNIFIRELEAEKP